MQDMKPKRKLVFLKPITEIALNAYRRVAQILSILAVLMALIAIVLSSYGEYIAVYLFGSDAELYAKVSLIAVVIYILVAAIVVAYSFYSLSKKKHESLMKMIECSQEMCKQHENFLADMGKNNDRALQSLMSTLSSSWSNTEFSNCFILNSQVDVIESSVEINGTIYIFTSDFLLETEELGNGNENFIDIIVRNFQKGVVYKYIIPNTPSCKRSFEMISKSWFSKYSSFILSEDIKNSYRQEIPSYFSTKFSDIVRDVIAEDNPDADFIKTKRQKLKELFASQLIIYTI